MTAVDSTIWKSQSTHLLIAEFDIGVTDTEISQEHIEIIRILGRLYVV